MDSGLLQLDRFEGKSISRFGSCCHAVRLLFNALAERATGYDAAGFPHRAVPGKLL